MINSIKEEARQKKTYKIKSDKNNIFTLEIINSTKTLDIIAYIEDNLITVTYRNNYILDSIKEKNKYLFMFESIDEIYLDIILLLDKNKSIIIEEESNIIIKIPLESIKFKEIILTLNKLTKS